MNVYLSTAQAKSIVLQLMQIFPEGVSLCDEDGVILSSSDTGRINRTSPLAKQCIEQANSGKPYNERVVDGNVTATPLFFKDVCVGAVLMLGDNEQIQVPDLHCQGGGRERDLPAVSEGHEPGERHHQL